MKLFKKDKKKKPLSDKAKDERKAHIKHVLKIILDILMYGFAIIMALALVVGGSCSPKVAQAYYHSDNGYTSINSVVANRDSTTTLRFYYDYNYKKTLPNYSTLFDVFGTSSVGTIGVVDFVEAINIDSVRYDTFEFYKYSASSYQYIVRNSSTYQTLTIVTFTLNDTTINRSDVFTTIFNGVTEVKCRVSNDYNINWFQYLTYYFGPLGYNRIIYDMPVLIKDFNYLFIDSDNTDNSIENGLFIKNSNFPVLDDENGASYISNVFLGSFRVNGVYYTGINFVFTSVCGNYTYNNWEGTHYLPVEYKLPGRTGVIKSTNEFYNGFYYLDRITYTGYGVQQVVWQACSYEKDNDGTYHFIKADFTKGGWVGDTYQTSTPYRSLYINYASDSLSGVIHHPFDDEYPQLTGFTFADFLNYIGEAYPSSNPGLPYETTPVANVFEWLRLALSGAMPMFSYTILPGITLGTLIMVPVVMTILLFLIKLFKR